MHIGLTGKHFPHIYKRRECYDRTISKPENTVERRWLERLWDHGNLFQTCIVRDIEYLS